MLGRITGEVLARWSALRTIGVGYTHKQLSTRRTDLVLVVIHHAQRVICDLRQGIKRSSLLKSAHYGEIRGFDLYSELNV